MKTSNVALMAAALTLATSCSDIKQESNAPIIGRQEITVKDGRMTPEALWAMGRIGNMSVSPDGKKIAYTVAYYSVEQDKLMNKYNIVITSSILKTVSVFILDNVFFFKFYFVLKYS